MAITDQINDFRQKVEAAQSADVKGFFNTARSVSMDDVYKEVARFNNDAGKADSLFSTATKVENNMFTPEAIKAQDDIRNTQVHLASKSKKVKLTPEAQADFTSMMTSADHMEISERDAYKYFKSKYEAAGLAKGASSHEKIMAFSDAIGYTPDKDFLKLSTGDQLNTLKNHVMNVSNSNKIVNDIIEENKGNTKAAAEKLNDMANSMSKNELIDDRIKAAQASKSANKMELFQGSRTAGGIKNMVKNHKGVFGALGALATIGVASAMFSGGQKTNAQLYNPQQSY